MRKLNSLQMLRAVAAILVVLYHAQLISTRRGGELPLGGIFSAGSRGVDLFFVLSGFIIGHVHGADLDRPGRLLNYAFNRIARIYPAVLIMTAFAACTYAAGFGGAEKAAKLSTWSAFASVSLLPQAGPALVNVTWTLKYEMFFYVIFAIAILQKQLGLCALLLWQGLVVVAWIAVPQNATGLSSVPPASLGLGGFYLRSLCLEFSLGLCCAFVVDQPSFTVAMRRGVAQAALLCAGIAMFVLGMARNGHSVADGVFCAAGAACIIVSLVLLEGHGRIAVPSLPLLLGDASYSIYMVHYAVITFIAVILARFKAVPVDDGVYLAGAIVGIAAGLVFHLAIDQPIQRFLRRTVKPALLAGSSSRDAALTAEA